MRVSGQPWEVLESSTSIHAEVVVCKDRLSRGLGHLSTLSHTPY
jgi:hypothetical protein